MPAKSTCLSLSLERLVTCCLSPGIVTCCLSPSTSTEPFQRNASGDTAPCRMTRVTLQSGFTRDCIPRIPAAQHRGLPLHPFGLRMMVGDCGLVSKAHTLVYDSITGSRANTHLSDAMYLSISFRKSSLPQNGQLDISTRKEEVGEGTALTRDWCLVAQQDLTSYKAIIEWFWTVSSPTRSSTYCFDQ